MTEPWRLLALPPMPKDLLELLFGDERLEVVVPAERTQAAVEELVPTVDLLLGDWTPQLRITTPGDRVCFVQQPSVGTDGIDLAACAAQGVPVANCAGSNSVSVAEWCVGATLNVLRKTLQADQAVRRGEWPQTELGGRELAGSKVGIVGMGPIGVLAARLYTAFGCDVTYWSRSQKPDAPATWQGLDELITTSDVVVLVIALGPETRGLVDPRRMKPGSVLVHAARGEVLVEEAVTEAAATGVLFALDVFSTEPLPMGDPVRALDGVLLSPHLAGTSQQAAMRIVAQAKANLQRALAGEPVLDVVNAADPVVRRRPS
ncbi:MAG: NAD(P)-dependent oxidoreductase [Mycobacteriales bacterium]|nr:NAD(P)-dependent oxidoreductase [Mycobacteriales bacterium]